MSYILFITKIDKIIKIKNNTRNIYKLVKRMSTNYSNDMFLPINHSLN